MNEHPKKRKRKTLHPSRYSDAPGISRIADGFSGIFSDHCYSVCSMRQPDFKYFDNKDDDSDPETASDLPKFADGIKTRNRNQSSLVPSPVLRVLERTAFSAEKSADVEICDEECGSPELVPQQTQEEGPLEVHAAEDVPIAVEVHAISEDYDVENNSSESLPDQTEEEPPAKLCKILDKSQALNVTAQQKWPLLRANSSGLYKCELCEFNSKYFSDLKQHMILKHKRTDLNVCRVCKERFSTRVLLIEHTKLHGEDPYICKYCDYKTVILENLSQHIADIHFGAHLYWCEQCDVQFSSSSDLYLHFQQHSCDEQYLCQFCEHETGDPEDLHSHVVNEHACKLIELSDKRSGAEHGRYGLLSKIAFDKCKNFFVCQVCGFRSRLHTNVNRHVAIEHTKIFPHVCDDCGKGFSSMLEYCKHLSSHLSEGIYLCQYCEYSTAQIEDLKIHLDFKHSSDLPHKCSDCLMRFGNERELISHLPVHDTT
ncbi:zinc finger protein 639 [Nannospalax galili]|uniref:Zinc finger protein 639 n=1 Tax=Nannospalax galili TaxID=1026970 RepID=A0A8C6RDC4_NANGA|nr:zinc finger protein 639 [Nannospalax galili]XP_017655018.1 zinc finger protein 639 [Nannospalax galili]XP_029422065.1 zinc finger protein 639 [Nannospalax galili]XP_029422066.1 zinc finger protein 639 [Nannospalax galili]XP_029422067.1 zinc finger protein 639 [Nannospalax galili]XP_029422068.1 zinc finger protein 639 [Nannospalax galili]